jgi:hypothetical protein
MENPVPQGWKTITIRSIFNQLSKEDQKLFMEAVKANHDLDRNIAVFREIFIRNQQKLELNNMDPKFFAYAVANALEQLRKGSR